ncbi:alanine--tRNA ligase-related protein [Halobaculum gomorrense]|uniref:Alanyl-tRNA synthetase n=1 Tax=Halobaculum gomorrense TaxID=43928 RepID=A0A1M5SB06_9EURY|nr:DHHA1 domain-containing protein [Halobaculum gomorrense]SHH35641.1 alanyl-tRNA synthetase [Halobaculum gomorrense]
MSDSLAPAQPEVREFKTTVESIDGRDVTLPETYFYPEGGGQPADRGTLGGVTLDDVQSRGEAVVHTLAESPAFEAGDTVAGVVDDDFRTYCMRAHTASHVLYGAGRRLLEDLGYGGFGITDEKVRVDFETSTDIDDDVLVDLERLVNRAVWDSRPVSWETRAVEDARADGAVAFNDKTEADVMADADSVRVVTVEGWDEAACGGTHVSDTREIGPVTVLDRSNPGEGLTRVEFAVGPVAIDRRSETHRELRAAAREAGVGVDGVADAVSRLAGERDDLADDLASLREEVLVGRVRELPAVERDGNEWRIGVIEGFNANAVGEAAQSTVGDAADAPDAPDVVAAVGGGPAPFVVVAAAGAVDAGEVVDRVTDEFGGGGGGAPAFAQGGGLDAEPGTVVEFLGSTDG